VARLRTMEKTVIMVLQELRETRGMPAMREQMVATAAVLLQILKKAVVVEMERMHLAHMVVEEAVEKIQAMAEVENLELVELAEAAEAEAVTAR
jgi:hypothetical protein